MSEPTWKLVITDELLKELDFTLPRPEDEKPPDYEEVAMVTIPASYNHARLLSYKSDPDHLYFVLDDDELDWLRLPIEPTETALRELHAQYIKPAMDIAKPRVGESMLGHIAYLREATGRVNLDGEVKTLRWLLGYGGAEETMVSVENGLTMCGFTDPAGIRQATGSNEAHSQFSTSFSASLVTVTRMLMSDTEGYFTLEIEYHPSDLCKTGELAKQHAKHTPEVPDDIPIDVVGLFEKMQFTNLVTAETLRASVDAGDATAVMPYAFTLDYNAFDEVFMPLASHEDRGVRSEVAHLAAFRKNKKMYDAAKTKGISDLAIKSGKAVWPDGGADK